MEPAATIIRKFGGSVSVSKIVDLHRTQVSRWRWPRGRGGTGGRIPQVHIDALLNAALAQSIDLTLQDFFPDIATPTEAA